jgi:hypothetical protein
MLIVRYFLYVGGALLALLLLCNAMLPPPPAVDANVVAAEHPLIRIHSDRKWPKPIVFDTNMPRIAPPVAVASNATVPPAPATTADVSAKTRVREAFAQLPAPQTAATESKAQPAKTRAIRPPPKRRIAKARPAPRPLMLVAQQPPRFGLFDTTW